MADVKVTISSIVTGSENIRAFNQQLDKITVSGSASGQMLSAYKQKASELATAVRSGKMSLEDAEKSLISYRDNLATAGTTTGNFRAGLIKATAALAAIGLAAREAYKEIKAGAELEFTRKQFDNLAESIGTTGDVLLTSLKDTSKGMMSDAALISGATDLINTGIAKTADQAAFLTNAVGALGLNMNQLTLTLLNDSKMRLDALKLSAERVAEIQKQVKAEGFVGDSFDEAVFRALAEKMELLGDASETTAGELRAVEADWKNITDTMKRWSAQAAAPAIHRLAELSKGLASLSEPIDRGVVPAWKRFALAVATAVGDTTSAIVLTKSIQKDLEGYSDEMARAAVETSEAAEMAAAYRWETRQTADVLAVVQGALDATTTITGAYTVAQDMATNAIDGMREAQFRAKVATDAARAALAAELAEFKNLTGIVDGVSGSVHELFEAQNELATLAPWDIAGFETASGRASAAADEISASIHRVGLSVIEAGLQTAIAAGDMDALAASLTNIQAQAALGLISPEEAAKLEEIAVKSQRVQDVTTTMFDEAMADGVVTQEELDNIAVAIGLIEEGAPGGADALDEMARRGVTSMSDLAGETGNAGAAVWELKDAADEFAGGDPYTATLRVDGVDEMISKIRDLIGAIGDAKAAAASAGSGGGWSGGTPPPGTGGPGQPGPNAKGQHGLPSFVVPPGYSESAGRPFVVHMESGEKFGGVTPRGGTENGGQSMRPLTVNIFPPPGMSPEAIASKVARIATPRGVGS